MITVLAALALNVAMQAQPPRRPAVVRDSTPIDSTKRRVPRRLAVTADLLQTAFESDRSREIFARARRARLVQDSSLKTYDATARQRMTARIGIGRGLDRIAYRTESAFHVQWQLGVGARVELTGARVGIPMAPHDAEREDLQTSVMSPALTPIPYSPGQESLWIMGRQVNAEVDDRSVVHPLAEGAEAYYTYAAGDSMTWRLPDGQVVRLRELKVRPRSPRWNLAVGSLWFDERTGQLVRAAYRLASPIDVFARVDERNRDEGRSGPSPTALKVIKFLASPMRVEISAVVIEYGLFSGKFWMPRSRSLAGAQQISFAHMPVEIAESFSYATINGPLSLGTIATNEPDPTRPEIPDTLSDSLGRVWRDSVFKVRREAHRAFIDSLNKAPCDSTGYRLVGRMRAGMDVPVSVRYPCDVDKLASSPDLPKSLYASDETLFSQREAEALIADALPFGAQAAIALGALPRPNFQYGLSMTRYNRIEGLSSGIMSEQQLGGGYLARATGRIGTADREPNVELTLARTNLSKTVSLTGYNRLVSASDWGSPLSFGSSFAALVFGRDEGFYYRASGAELRWSTQRGAHLDWRLFGEQERTAVQQTDYSFGASFTPNVRATHGGYAGAGLRWLGETGLDPHGFRTLTDLRLETATGASDYGRAAVDVTFSSGLPMSLAAALTLGGGTSVGAVPPQRRWFLGGTQTIRGQSPDTSQSGNAFWMSRLEIAADRPGYRYIAFSDLGWTGDRSKVGDLIRPMSGVGIGMSVFDGLVRFDIARGFYPRRQTRLDFYLGGRF